MCPKGPIVGEADFNISVLRFDAGLFLTKTCQPRVAIGMGVVKGGEEGTRAFRFKVSGADVGSGRPGAKERRRLVSGDEDAFHA